MQCSLDLMFSMLQISTWECTRRNLRESKNYRLSGPNRSRVSNWKSGSIQNHSISVYLVWSTLGKIETTLQIGKILERVCENAILNHKHKYQKWYMTKIMYTRATARVVMYTASIGYFKGLIISTHLQKQFIFRLSAPASRVDVLKNTEMNSFACFHYLGWTP